jgi:rhodanese-related sulfurtransferase
MSGKFVGDVTPQQAWDDIAGNSDAALVDVRTHAEWSFVGLPDLSELGREVVTVEWQTFPGMTHNSEFLAQLARQDVSPDRPVYLLCRSGVRSRHAAQHLAQHGYTTFNISDGFEGPLDSDGRRGTVAGWKADGLAWKQS